jgi:hypothetical protein
MDTNAFHGQRNSFSEHIAQYKMADCKFGSSTIVSRAWFINQGKQSSKQTKIVFLLISQKLKVLIAFTML